MTRLTQWQLRIALEAPFLTQSSSAADLGLDAAVARKPDGKPYLPGTLITGNLLHAWNAWKGLGVAGAAGFCNLLGTTSDASYSPYRKRLLFGDMDVTEATDDNLSPTQRIRISESAGAVEKGAIMMIEQPWAPAMRITFQGKVRCFTADGEKPDEIARAIQAGLEWAGQLGAEKGVGFGRIAGIELVPDSPPQYRTSDQNSLPLKLTLIPERDLCFTDRNISYNLFEGREVIPGAAIKGALATTWAALLGKPLGSAVSTGFDPQRPALAEHFDKILVLHAFPGRAGKRAVAPPQSLVKAGKGKNKLYRDVAKESGEYISINGEAAAFQIDWKGLDFAGVTGYFGWPDLWRDLRVRTAIEQSTGRAKDEALFAYESVVPDGETTWYTEIRLDGVPGGQEVTTQLLNLLQALGGEIGYLGKTKAFATVRLENQWNPAQTGAIGSGPEWIIALQTPAFIGDWRDLDETAGAEEMQAMYATAFRDLDPKVKFELIRYFARQRLAGGRYLHHRFRRKGQGYRPWLLTEAGSVFVLRAAQGCERGAADCIAAWRRGNLPLPKWLEEEADGRPRWQAIPYLPEGGYGEINVNLACHDGNPLQLETDGEDNQ